MNDFTLPINLIKDYRQQQWIERLPGLVDDLVDRWSLDDVGDPYQPGGQTAWVAPVRIGPDQNLVLKIGWKHPEAAHEAAGLIEWDGEGAVRLHAYADMDQCAALLLERCLPGTALAQEPEAEQDVVVAGLLRRLWREPSQGHSFRSLQLMCNQWADGFERSVKAGGGTLDPGLARAGIELFRSLPATAERNVLLCTDLHAENVLASKREPWLVIDPKPYVGDPAYDVLQHMLNCEERLNSDPRGLALRMADLVGMDGERIVLWLFARCLQESPDSPMLAEVARRLAPR